MGGDGWEVFKLIVFAPFPPRSTKKSGGNGGENEGGNEGERR